MYYVVALALLHLLSICTFSGTVLMGYEDRRRPAGAAHEVAHAVEWGYNNVKIGNSLGVSGLKRTTGVHRTEMRSGFGPIGGRGKFNTP